MLGAAAFEAVGIGLIMPFVSLIAHPELTEKYALLGAFKRFVGATTHLELVSTFGLALVGVYLLKNAYLALVQYAQYRYVFRCQTRLANELFETYLRRPYTFHLQSNSAELVHDIHYETSQFYNHVGVSVFTIAVEGLSLAVIAALLVAIEPVVVPAVSIVLGGVSMLFYRLIHKRATRTGEQQREAQAQMHKWLQIGLGGVKEARVIGCEDYFVQHYASRSLVFGNALTFHHVLAALPRYVLETTGVLGLVTMTMAMFARGGRAELILPVLGALAIAAVRLLPSVARLLGAFSLVRFCKPTIEALWNATLPREGDGTHGIKLGQIAAQGIRDELAIDDVHYTYPNATRPALRGVSFRVKRGESIAVVGGSGAGKTTLVDVVIGLLAPTKGALRVDNELLEGGRLLSWQRSIGYIPQTVFLSDDDIRRNVAFGIPDDEIDDARVEKALAAARLDDLVNSLADGTRTFVGERGVRLSGGQRQRIGIARALYLEPEILILDEATSSLDTSTEKEIVESFEAVRKERTAIVIAHRLSTLRGCDRLVLMGDGRVEQIGTWDELMTTNAEFRRMVDLARVNDVSAA